MAQDIVEKISPTGFIAEYITYCQTLTDAPVEFHLGAGLTALSTACGSNVIYPGYGGRSQWPNLYTLLIAPSGLYRKSTAVGIAEDLIAKVDSSLILSGEQSREKFLAILKDSPNVLYPISEFSAVLSMWNRDYAQGFKEIVTDLFDCRNEYARQTLRDGKVIIAKPALNILAASTADWLREKLTEGDLRGGLMGRFIMIPGVNKGEDPGLNVSPNTIIKESMIHFLKQIRLLQKSFVDVKPILEDYNEWAKRTEQKITQVFNPDIIGFQSRLASHTLKLAVLFTISEYGALPKYTINLDNLQRAITLSQWLLEKATEMAATGFVKTKTEHLVQKLIGLASRNGGVAHSEAIRTMHISSREFDGVVRTAVERGEIRVEQEKTSRRPVKFYLLPEGQNED